MSKVMLDVRELTTKYITRFRENIYAVDHVSLQIEEGKSLGIAGESGCGKSTLALSLMGYYFPPLHYSSGEIIIDGQDITGMDPDEVRRKILGNEIAYIPQAAMNALNPTQKVIHLIEDVVKAHTPTSNNKEIYDLAAGFFEAVGLPVEVLDKHPVELSGGMKQRTVIAISVILHPKILIADEPSSALDVTSQKRVIKMLRDLMDNGLIQSMIFITHELPLLYNVTDDIMVMYAGYVMEYAPRQDFLLSPKHPYTLGLIRSVPLIEARKSRRLEVIPGFPPDMLRLPPGCPFAPRCTYAQERCQDLNPALEEIAHGHWCACHFPVPEADLGLVEQLSA